MLFGDSAFRAPSRLVCMTGVVLRLLGNISDGISSRIVNLGPFSKLIQLQLRDVSALFHICIKLHFYLSHFNLGTRLAWEGWSHVAEERTPQMVNLLLQTIWLMGGLHLSHLQWLLVYQLRFTSGKQGSLEFLCSPHTLCYVISIGDSAMQLMYVVVFSFVWNYYAFWNIATHEFANTTKWGTGNLQAYRMTYIYNLYNTN